MSFDELTPEPMSYLGQVAYLQLDQFESIARTVSMAPDLASKERLSPAASAALAKHQGVIAEIRRRGAEPDAVMAPFAEAIDRYQRATQGARWHEALLSNHLTAGLLDDFFISLASGLPGDFGPRVASVLAADSGREQIVEMLGEAIAADPVLGSRLAMWGRRLVGDTLLLARSGLSLSGDAASDESRIEPVFTELIAAHTRRMDALGLTA
ncbi:tRNA-(MS[2]IO[6]A)-hydroxylase MiaE-like protein [Compostimonas suwonensis]|uniref:tRNA-(MS[2]IO[6]A)-hydroxylase MiaE-like protein n=1 Tax=Compostimonas suwonensis TaxID=1048394 RepID=A0A2M9BWF1_9MICO|nr:tRNA-(MS[2]IO[6]A)-hydroxylase MiaE-like protein [Compostimonas suwonensis]